MMALVTFGLALVLSLLLVLVVRHLCLRRGYVAQPRGDRWHQEPTPVLGGVAIFLAFIASIIVSFLISGGGIEVRWGLLAVAGFVFFLGLYDDVRELSPQAKLVGQVLAATAIIYLGYTTQFFSPRIENEIVAQIPNIILTYIWVIGITNAINLLDNMDGLAGGIALIVAIFLTQGGRDHTSHRLIAFGLNERQTVFVLYAIALISGIIAAVLESLNYWFSLILVPVLILSLAILAGYLGRLKVVVSSASVKSDRAITRFMVDLTYRRRLLEVVLDLFLISMAYYLAFFTRYGLSMTQDELMLYLRTLPFAYAGTYISFFVFGVYRGLWRYIGVDDLVRFLKSAVGAAVLMILPVILLPSTRGYPAMLLIFYAVFLFLALAASRISFKVLDQVYAQQTREREERVLILGAGDAGEMALRWILMNPELGYRPVGFLDDDVFKTGRQIHGVEVLGDMQQLADFLEDRHIDGVILTADACDGDGTVDHVVEVCRTHKKWIRNLRFEFELLE